MELTSEVNELQARLATALQLKIPYANRFPRPEGAKAAVLILFGFENGVPSLLLTRRTETVENHKGQMAFPGGVCDPDEDSCSAALRETQEEVGISSPLIHVVGEMPELSTFTGFSVTPVLGVLKTQVSSLQLTLSASEIAEALWIHLDQFSSPGVYRTEMFGIGAVKYPIHVFQVGDYRIWGATAAMVKNLLERLSSLG